MNIKSNISWQTKHWAADNTMIIVVCESFLPGKLYDHPMLAGWRWLKFVETSVPVTCEVRVEIKGYCSFGQNKSAPSANRTTHRHRWQSKIGRRYAIAAVGRYGVAFSDFWLPSMALSSAVCRWTLRKTCFFKFLPNGNERNFDIRLIVILSYNMSIWRFMSFHSKTSVYVWIE